MSRELFLQAFANSLSMGALFGLLGLSFGIIYSTTKVLHFAHGAIYVLAAYSFFATYVIADLPLAGSVLLTLASAGLLGFLTMHLLYKPLLRRSASQAIVMIASLGLYVVVENILILIFGNDSRIVSKFAVQAGVFFGGVYLTRLQLFTMGISLCTFAAAYLWLTRSRLGQAMRGMAEDLHMAEIVGIDIRRLRYVVFIVGSVLLGIAAVLTSLDLGISPQAGLKAVLIAAVAAIVGGVKSAFAGAAGGLLIGFVHSFGVLWIDPRWQNSLIFSALIVVILFRPAGLFQNAR